MAYIIRDRECGIFIDEAETLEEARKIVEDFEKEDKLDEVYTPDFYEIVKED